MAVKLRLTRMGRRKRPFYRIVAIDSRKRRDGAYIESIGWYDPLPNPSIIKVDEEKALKWLRVGAIMTPRVKNLFSRVGVVLKFTLEKNQVDEAKRAEIIENWMKQNRERVAGMEQEASVPQAEKKTEAAPEPEEAVEESAEETPAASEEKFSAPQEPLGGRNERVYRVCCEATRGTP